MTQPTAPEKAPAMLPGPASSTWAKIAFVLAAALALQAVGWPIFYFATGSTKTSPNPVIYVYLWALGIGVVVYHILLLAMFLRGRAESRAGYTTAAKRYIERPQLDPKTGRIVRAAFEPYIDRKTYRERVKSN